MEEEIQAACDFLARLISAQLSVSQQALFKQALARLLKEKYVDHWDVSQPMRGNAYRSIMVTPGFIDPVLLKAAAEADVRRVETRWFPTDLVVWIDPFEVTYRFGEMGSIARIYVRPPDTFAASSAAASSSSSSSTFSTSGNRSSCGHTTGALPGTSGTSTPFVRAAKEGALSLLSGSGSGKTSCALSPRPPVPISSGKSTLHTNVPSSSSSTSTTSKLSPSSVKAPFVNSSAVSEPSRILVH